MIVGIFLLLLSLIFGYVLLSKFDFAKSPLERFGLGIPIGIASAAFIMLAIYAILGTFSYAVTDATIILLAGASVLLCAKRQRNFSAVRANKFAAMPNDLVAGVLAISAIIGIVFASNLYMSNGSIYCGNIGMCSDFMYHFGIGVSLLTYHFPPLYPFTIKAINVFPFINDFYSAVLYKYGFGITGSFIITDILLIFSSVTISSLLIYKMTRSTMATIFSETIFWFGSDFIMAFVFYPLAHLLPFYMQYLMPPRQFLSIYGITANGALGMATASMSFTLSTWNSPIYALFMPQHDLVLGFPLGLLIIYLLYIFIFDNGKMKIRDYAFLGAAIGMTPLVHPSTLVVSVIVAAFAFLYLLAKEHDKKVLLRNSAVTIVVLALFSLPQIAYMLRQRLAAGWFHFIYQYLVVGNSNLYLALAETALSYTSFWVETVGIPVVVLIFGYKFAKREIRIFFVPFFIIWILISIFSIQPNPLDSNKIFVYVLLIIDAIVGYSLYLLYRKNSVIFKFATIVIIVLICGNFAIEYGYWAIRPYVWISSAQINAAKFIGADTPEPSVFAVSNYQSKAQIVSTIAGRTTLISVLPYVSIDEYTYPLALLAEANSQMLDGNCTAIENYNISYIYLQTSNLSAEAPFENGNFSRIYNAYDAQTGQHIEIYKALCNT